jgi:plastocyanin
MLRNRRFLTIVLALTLAAGFGPRVLAQNSATVNVVDFEFQPKTLTVPVGTTVTWTNNGAKKHSATADDGSFDTDLFDPGQSKSVTFDKPGTFAYYCRLHGAPGGNKMAGVIQVGDAPTSGSTGGSTGSTGEATEAAEPTAAPTQAAPGAFVEPDNKLTFADKAGRADSVTITLKGIAPLAQGHVLAAWLLEGQGNPRSLGALTVSGDTATLTFADARATNLIGAGNRVLITDQQGNDLKTPGTLVYSGDVPAKAMIHIRHVLFKFPETPKNAGLLLGALDNGKILVDHVGLAQKSFDAKDIRGVRLHLEHIYNVAMGTAGGKDLNENGKVDNPPDADGFGVIPYLQRASEHAKLAAEAPDATDRVKFFSNTVQAEISTAIEAITQITALAEQGEAANEVAETRPVIDQIVKLAGDNLKAGGAVKAYGEALKMASVDLTPATGGDQPPVAPTSDTTAPTAQPEQPTATQPVAQPPAGNTQTVAMKDFEFIPKELTVTVGTTVTWVNEGKKKHSATADDESFDTSLFDPGQSKSITFDKPGTFAYYCQLHGDKGGTAMAGVVTVK